jgi:hypothetical protein
LLKLVGRMQMLQSQIAAQQAATQLEGTQAPSDPALTFDEAVEEDLARAEGEEGEEEEDDELDDDEDDEGEEEDEEEGEEDEMFGLGEGEGEGEEEDDYDDLDF